MLRALEWNTGEGQTAHPGRLQTTSTQSTTRMHVRRLLMLLNAFRSEQEFVLVRGCATPPLFSPSHLLVSQLTARQEREERKADHIS